MGTGVRSGLHTRRGFAAVGLRRPKSSENVGGVLRAAHCYDASLVAVDERVRPARMPTNTTRAERHVPLVTGDLKGLTPCGATPVAVDLVDDAESLVAFQHPRTAFYVFGPEDGTLDDDVLSWCTSRVYVPTRHCMNLAATVNVVLYDRMSKAVRQARGVANADCGWSGP